QEKQEPPKTDARTKFWILSWIVVHNACFTLIMRYSRIRDVDEMFLPSVAVFVTELLKLTICFTMLMYEEGPEKFVSTLRAYTVAQPLDTLKVCVPAMLYVVQNTLFYVAASHLEAAIFAIVSQTKIFAAAMCSVFLLGKTIAPPQWVAIVILFCGVSLVQSQKSSAAVVGGLQNPLFGVVCLVIGCFISGLAGAYTEKIVKGRVSIWIRNTQMAIFSIPACLLSMFAQDGTFIMENRMLYGFDAVVWFTVFWYGIGGISVAFCLKYADIVSKDFATSVAIILSTLGSIFFFNFTPTPIFLIGAILVMFAIFMYSSPDLVISTICFQRRNRVGEEKSPMIEEGV
ncbi:hypothetical protein PFISCL1PPCAC_17830, partial [Pristionchus fissidentatus]